MLQLLDQMLMPRLMLMLGMDTMVTGHGDIMDTTDHTDTGDTMARDLLMRLPPPLDQIPMLMLILGMDTMVTDHGDMLDTTDHTDTGDTMAKDLLMRLPLPLDLTQMLKLIHITDMAMA